MANLIKLLALVAILWAIYKLVFGRKPKNVIFEMHFKNGHLQQHSGKIPDRFARECRAIAKKGKLSCVVRAQDLSPVKLHVSPSAGAKYAEQIHAAFPHQQYQGNSPAKA